MNPNFLNSNPVNPTMKVNDDKHHALRQYNTFNMDYDHALTARFGDETPFYVFDTWAGDKVPFGSFHKLITPVLQSQLMSDIHMHKSYFSVPYPAIYPRTWDRFITNPTQGDDVPLSLSNSVFSVVQPLRFLNIIRSIYSTLPTIAVGNYEYFLNIFFRHYFIYEAYFSRGSLLHFLGCKLTKYYRATFGLRDWSFDQMAERLFEIFRDALQDGVSAVLRYNFKQDGTYTEVKYDGQVDHTIDNSNYVSWHRFLELMRDNTDFLITLDGIADTSGQWLTDLWSDITGIFKNADVYNNSVQAPIPVNHSRLIAYQLIAAHFVSNDSVDFIYSADTWRSKINNILYGAHSRFGGVILSSKPLMFSYNGEQCLYDDYSGHVLNLTFGHFSKSDIYTFDEENWYYKAFLIAYMHIYELHRFCKSLKFGDYFNGARPHPYAVGDLSAPVVNNGVSAIDMSKNIQMQRFLAAVNKTGRKISDYFKGLTGNDITPRITDPKFLARDSQVLGSQEIENTADNQGAIVTLLRSEQSRFAFEVDITDPAILIGTLSFSVKRPYANTIERFFFHQNRFDFFNPYMQYTGDQQIYRAEKTNGSLNDSYAYQMRYAEYKQRYGQVSGGFVDFLKSWLFIADDVHDVEEETDNISPANIRSSNAEFDRFFAQLTNSTPAGYFHFVFKFDNISSPNRNMDATPTIM